ncbi:MAG TPA: NADH-quinone oxidoreductase subunit J [Cyclobacteriaceae bacterium]|nr:NADH-quinone oxidoreductase subunit J [Cyclobacteriaceae bacterium]
MTLNLFYFLSFFGVICALLVVFSRNAVHSVLYLILTFFAIAGHYILLNAQFLAAVHVIVYAGAIMVLFLYVIMLLNLNQEAEPHKSTVLKFAAAISAGLLLTVFVGSLKGTELMAQQQGPATNVGLVKSLGRLLFTEYLLPFEISSVLLLAAMVGAVMLGKSEQNTDTR